MRKHIRYLRKIIVIAGLMGLLYGCKSDSTTYPSPPPTATFYDKRIQPIFTENCSNLGCHPGGGAPFSLAPGVSYASLVNVAAVSGSCPGTSLRVKPGSADSSVLYQRLEADCGLNRMPKGLPALSQALIDSVEHWIDRGAHQDF